MDVLKRGDIIAYEGVLLQVHDCFTNRAMCKTVDGRDFVLSPASTYDELGTPDANGWMTTKYPNLPIADVILETVFHRHTWRYVDENGTPIFKALPPVTDELPEMNDTIAYKLFKIIHPSYSYITATTDQQVKFEIAGQYVKEREAKVRGDAIDECINELETLERAGMKGGAIALREMMHPETDNDRLTRIKDVLLNMKPLNSNDLKWLFDHFKERLSK